MCRLSVGISLAILATIVSESHAVPLSADANAMPSWRGNVAFTNGVLIASVDYAVFAPGQYGAGDASGGCHYVYAYQVFDLPNSQRELTNLTVGLLSPTTAFNAAYDPSRGVTSPPNVAPNAQVINTANSYYYFTSLWSSPTLAAGNHGMVVLMTSPNAPQFYYASVSGFGQQVNGLLPSPGAGRTYVRPSAAGCGNGSSWSNAYTLSAALADPFATEVWIASGIHKPAAAAGARTATFQISDGVALYGGFIGNETLIGQRDPTSNVTTLTGDMNGNDNQADFPNGATYSDNCYHVITAGAGTTLDGLTITGGNSSGAADPRGAGVLVSSGSCTVSNCTFTLNSAVGASVVGGAIAAPSGATIRSCTFTQNQAVGTGSGGGAIYVNANSFRVVLSGFQRNSANQGGAVLLAGSAAPYIANCTFVGNQAAQQGGAISNTATGTMTLANCIFVGNASRGQSGSRGGAVFNNGPGNFVNCTFASNISLAGGGIYNLAASPTLTNCIFWRNINTLGATTGEQIRRDSISPGAPVVTVGSSRVDLQACKLEYSIVSPK